MKVQAKRKMSKATKAKLRAVQKRIWTRKKDLQHHMEEVEQYAAAAKVSREDMKPVWLGEFSPPSSDRLAARVVHPDVVNHPIHYRRGGVEAIDVIEAFDLGMHTGTAVKYILRAGSKNHASEDLRKAIWYLVRHLRTAHKLEVTVQGGHVGASPIAD